jgi:hypothetical protein
MEDYGLEVTVSSVEVFDFGQCGGWPRSHKAFYPVEGAPGPSLLGTGEETPICR